MPRWILYALLSAVFAGMTSVLAKFGLKDVKSDVALVLRTAVVFGWVLIFGLSLHGWRDLGTIGWRNAGFLALSGCTTAASWILYYRAIAEGNVSTVAVIDKSSLVVTLALSFLILHEPVTWRTLAGGALVLAGMLVLIWK